MNINNNPDRAEIQQFIIGNRRNSNNNNSNNNNNNNNNNSCYNNNNNNPRLTAGFESSGTSGYTPCRRNPSNT